MDKYVAELFDSNPETLTVEIYGYSHLLGLSEKDCDLLLILIQFNPLTPPTQSRIAEVLKADKRTIASTFRRLKKLGYLQTIKTGRAMVLDLSGLHRALASLDPAVRCVEREHQLYELKQRGRNNA